MIVEIPIITRHIAAVTPFKAAKDVGYFLATPEPLVIPPHGAVIVDTGIRIAMPKDHGAMVVPLQRLLESGLVVHSMVYGPQHDTIKVVLQNLGGAERAFAAGDSVAQFVYVQLTETTRFFIQRRDLAPPPPPS